MDDPTRLTEITLFSRGDASKVATWSGLPQGCAQALEDAGVTVHRVDLSPGRRARGLMRLIFRLHRRLPAVRGWKPDRQLADNVILSLAARRKIVAACRGHPGSQCNVFLTYSFSSRPRAPLPVVHYCDQCYAEFLEGVGRSPRSWAEKFRFREEEAALRSSDLLISTNPHCIDFLRERFRLRNVFPEPLYGMSLVGYHGRPFARLESKRQNTDIVFVGSSVKNRGLDVLLEAFQEFNHDADRGYTLHIVGFDQDDVPGVWPNTRWYGRLDKAHPEQASIYWSLLDSARMFVIPSRTGPLPGVIFEAQYLGTPVITTSVWDAKLIVRDGESGLLIDGPRVDLLLAAMRALASETDLWDHIAHQGHEMAKNWLWERVAGVLLEQLTRVVEAASA